jgi:N-acetylneuraminic acid mutarotase
LISSKAKTIFILTLLAALLPTGTHGAEAGNRPSPRFGHRMVYDPVNERTLLFGGAVYENRYTFFDDLWAYDYASNTWTEIDCGPGPSGRFNFMMVYVPEAHGLFMFGGFSANDRISDTWMYDIEGNAWTELDPPDGPSPRSDAAIVYDPENGVVILHDGYCRDDSHPGDVWVYDFSVGNWRQMDPDEGPLPQYGHHMVYDSLNGRVVMYGGHWSIPDSSRHGYSDGVWVYDYPTDSWTKIDEATTPPSRYWHSLAYDVDSGRLVVFGGSVAGDVWGDDTWLFDASTTSWESIETGEAPPGRVNSAMAYHQAEGKIIMFGGLEEWGEPPLNDLWILDPVEGTWEERGAAGVEAEEEQQEDTTGTGIPGFPVASLALGVLISVIFLSMGAYRRQ